MFWVTLWTHKTLETFDQSDDPMADAMIES